MKNFTTIQWFGVIILFNTTLLGGASQLGDLSLSPGIVKGILAIATLGNGFLGGLVTMFGGQTAQVNNVLAMPGIDHIAVNSQANTALAQIAVDPAQTKIAATPAAETAVTKTAAAA